MGHELQACLQEGGRHDPGIHGQVAHQHVMLWKKNIQISKSKRGRGSGLNHLQKRGHHDGGVDGQVVDQGAAVRRLDRLQVPRGAQLQVVLLVLHTLQHSESELTARHKGARGLDSIAAVARAGTKVGRFCCGRCRPTPWRI